MEKDFKELYQRVGYFKVKGKTFLIPQMNTIGGHLLAGTLRSFGVNAILMDTYKGLDLGKNFTSGKECFPCQVTTGDILYFLKREKERLGDRFNPKDYIYFMPESEGPCRFGMYNKFQRIVLDTFPEFRKIKIGTLSSSNSYSVEGLIEEAGEFRKVAYLSVIVGDILDRLLWRVRPYEKIKGSTDQFIHYATLNMEKAFERYGKKKDFDSIISQLEELTQEAKSLIDPTISPKPLIGVVGEIYLRTHVWSNQNVIRMIERYGGEVVNASIAEWINYTTYDRLREAKIDLRAYIRNFNIEGIKDSFKRILKYGIDLYYQQIKQDKVYKRIKKILDIADDHRLKDLEKVLIRTGTFSFDVGTEACLSISGIIEYIKEGYNGVVNVYPFTCMPSTITSAIIKPIITKTNVPYIDAPYDGSYQPGREAAIRTFMYQAQQHFERNRGRRRHH